MQRVRTGNPSHPGILGGITDCPEGKDLRLWPLEEVTRAEEAPPLPLNEGPSPGVREPVKEERHCLCFSSAEWGAGRLTTATTPLLSSPQCL